MKRLFFRLTALLCGLFSVYLVNAQSSCNRSNVTTTAVPFLRISPDARAGGLGEEGIATSPDANSAFYNLSKTPFSEYKTGIGLTYTPWLKDLGLNDVYLLAATGYHKLDELQACRLPFGISAWVASSFPIITGTTGEKADPANMLLTWVIPENFLIKFGIGLTMRYINSNLTLGAAAASGSISAYKAGTVCSCGSFPDI